MEKVIVNKEKDDYGKYVYFPMFLVRLEEDVKEYEDYEISEYRDKDGIIRLWIDESDILLVRSAEATAGDRRTDND